MAVMPRRYRFTVDEYERLTEILRAGSLDTSAAFDRGVKLPLYARAGIVETWLVGLGVDRVDLFRQPSTTGHAETRRLVRGDALAPGALPGLRVTVEDLLG